MKRTFPLWQALGFGITTLLGTILHFLYDWTGENFLIAPFAAVNESTWEHMKLLFWPLFLFALVQWFFFKEKRNFWNIKLAEILLGLLLIPVLFYTYNGAFGKSPDWVNIAIFYLSAALVFLFERWAFKGDRLKTGHNVLAFTGICIIGILFAVFTFLPPQLPLFQDPVTGSYGVWGINRN
jgi:hypothetical protein